MSLRIRDLEEADLEVVRVLNRAAVPHVNDVPVEGLQALRRAAAYFRVALLEGRVAGFLIALTPEADYASPNFRWFRARYERFLYIDRIVVAAAARGRGIGARLYDDLLAFGRGRAALLACEVNLRPPNEASLRFHRRHGFRQVGTQETDAGAKQVCLMVREIATGALRAGDRR